MEVRPHLCVWKVILYEQRGAQWQQILMQHFEAYISHHQGGGSAVQLCMHARCSLLVLRLLGLPQQLLLAGWQLWWRQLGWCKQLLQVCGHRQS